MARSEADRTADHQPRPRSVRRGVLAGLAVLAAAALVLSACSPFVSMLGADSSIEGPFPLPDQPVGTAESFSAQAPDWQDCGDGSKCADVYAPIDWSDPQGETITLRLVKQPATGGDPIGTLFVNPGGPGASGAEYIAHNIDSAVQRDVREKYDVIGWDPRGVGASTPVTCLDAAGMDEYLFGLGSTANEEPGSDEWIQSALSGTTEFGDACAKSTGPLLGHVGTDDTVKDLDMLRGIVGDTTLNYLGYSYGTYIGARYADAYPDRVGRFVLDGAMDPSTSLADVVREQTRGFEQALRAYVQDCLQRNGCPFDGTINEAMAQIGAQLDLVEANPLRGNDGRMLTSGTMLTAIITPLYSESSWGYLDDLFEETASGNADAAFMLADSYYDRQGGAYLTNSSESFSAINCLDYPNSLDIDRMRAEAAELEEIAPTIGRFQGYGDVSCAGWPYPGPEERTKVTAAGANPILVVGTTGDPATPFLWAASLADQLESGVLVTYKGEGHTAYGENDCVNTTVDQYLLTGEVPAEDPVCVG